MPITEIQGRSAAPAASFADAPEEVRAFPSTPVARSMIVARWPKFMLDAPRPAGKIEGLLRDLATPALRVRAPFDLTLEPHGDQWVADCPEVNEYGTGPTREMAVADLKSTIVELYEKLSAEPDRLGPDLAEVWHILSERIEQV